METPLFDTHVHLSSDPVFQAVGEQLARAKEQGVVGWVIPGVRPGHWERMVHLAETQADVWMAPGVHPMEEEQWTPESRQRLKTLLQHPRCLAVGEIGLDKRLVTSPERQEQVFREQLELAAEAQRPVLIHCCRRYGRLLEILDQTDFTEGGILHGFSGSLEVAQEGWKRGFVMGIGGLITRPESHRLRALAQALTPEALVLETDAPDGAPHPHRGEDNRLEWLPLIAQALAKVRDWTLAETAAITTQNARRCLKLD